MSLSAPLSAPSSRQGPPIQPLRISGVALALSPSGPLAREHPRAPLAVRTHCKPVGGRTCAPSTDVYPARSPVQVGLGARARPSPNTKGHDLFRDTDLVFSDYLEPLIVGEGGLEPPRPEGHWHLKPARLPFRHSPQQPGKTITHDTVLPNRADAVPRAGTTSRQTPLTCWVSILRIPLVTRRRAGPIPCRQGWWPGDTRVNSRVRTPVTGKATDNK